MAGVARLLTGEPGVGVVGIDIYGEAFDRLRLWRKIADARSTEELADLAVPGDGQTEFIEFIALQIVDAFGGSGSSADGASYDELLDAAAQAQPPGTPSSPMGALLATLLVEDDPLATRISTGIDVPVAEVQHLLRSLSGISRVDVQAMREALDRAARYLVTANLRLLLTAEADAHEALRAITTDRRLYDVTSSPILQSPSSANEQVQLALRHLAIGAVGETLEVLQRFSSWVNTNAEVVDRLILPALGADSWNVDEEESLGYARLVVILQTVRRSPPLLEEGSDRVIESYARSLFYYGNESRRAVDLVNDAERLVRDIRSQVRRRIESGARSNLFVSTNFDLSLGDYDDRPATWTDDDSRSEFFITQRPIPGWMRSSPSDLDAIFREVARPAIESMSRQISAAVAPITDRRVSQAMEETLLKDAAAAAYDTWMGILRPRRRLTER
jgi:hypothetical protein